MADDVERGPPPETEISKRVYDVIGDLQKHAVGARDRGDLRRALDKSEAPAVGRDAGDQALRRISRP